MSGSHGVKSMLLAAAILGTVAGQSLLGGERGVGKKLTAVRRGAEEQAEAIRRAAEKRERRAAKRRAERGGTCRPNTR